MYNQNMMGYNVPHQNQQNNPQMNPLQNSLNNPQLNQQHAEAPKKERLRLKMTPEEK